MGHQVALESVQQAPRAGSTRCAPGSCRPSRSPRTRPSRSCKAVTTATFEHEVLRSETPGDRRLLGAVVRAVPPGVADRRADRGDAPGLLQGREGQHRRRAASSRRRSRSSRSRSSACSATAASSAPPSAPSPARSSKPSSGCSSSPDRVSATSGRYSYETRQSRSDDADRAGRCRRCGDRRRAAARVPCARAARRRGRRPRAGSTARSRPPDVCASARSSCSDSGSAPQSTRLAHERVVALRAARDHPGREQVADAVDHRHGRGVDRRAATPEPREQLAEVAEQAEAGDVGRGVHGVAELDRRVAGAGVERRHHARRPRPRARRGAASRLTAVEITPSPIGFVSTSTSPARAPAFVSTWSGCTVPTTASPYFGSASSIECPPPTSAPAAAHDVAAAVEHACEQVERRGPRAASATRFSASERRAAHRVDVGERVRRGDAAPVVRVVDDRA